MADQSEHIFVKSTDSQYVDIVFSILRKCGYNMARKGLFHWIPSYSKRAIRKDCMSHWVVLFFDKSLDAFTSTIQMVKLNESELYLRKLATLPEYEGRGIGKANLLFAENFARENGFAKTKLDVYVKSEHAISLYRRLGYQVTGTKRSVRFRELSMEKDLW
jgi:Acetyltransferases